MLVEVSAHVNRTLSNLVKAGDSQQGALLGVKFTSDEDKSVLRVCSALDARVTAEETLVGGLDFAGLFFTQNGDEDLKAVSTELHNLLPSAVQGHPEPVVVLVASGASGTSDSADEEDSESDEETDSVMLTAHKAEYTNNQWSLSATTYVVQDLSLTPQLLPPEQFVVLRTQFCQEAHFQKCTKSTIKSEFQRLRDFVCRNSLVSVPRVDLIHTREEVLSGSVSKGKLARPLRGKEAVAPQCLAQPVEEQEEKKPIKPQFGGGKRNRKARQRKGKQEKMIDLKEETVVAENEATRVDLLNERVPPSVALAPCFGFRAGAKSGVCLSITVDAVVYSAGNKPLQDALVELLGIVDAHLDALEAKALSALHESPGSDIRVRTLNFHPPMFPHIVAHACHIAARPDTEDVPEPATAVEERRALHNRHFLPTNQPMFRYSNGLQWEHIGNGVDELVQHRISQGKLRNVHQHLAANASGLKGGTQYLVDGNYIYYHYMQDKFDDCGWGCAYRTFMTICSWFLLQQYTGHPVPTHREIQQGLVDLKDKPTSFVGSRQWIGAIELSMLLKHFLGVTAKTLFVSRGSDIPSHARQLAMHFEKQGTPVMIGGGQLAYGLLGVDYDSKTGDVRFLILDPHYTGAEDIPTILKKGWCGWHAADLFLPNVFYNFCLPQRPNII